MALFEIKSRFTGSVLFSLETENFKLCVEAAVKARANLARANLAGANLADANLARADLADANLARAYLADANLAGANLARADLAGADLAGAKLQDGIIINHPPIFVGNLTWPVLIFERHMRIGCQFHTHQSWSDFDDEEWIRMGGKEALTFKRAYRDALLALCAVQAAKSTQPKE